jgi:prepilin-type N-terminal cleavage/methylation domain-containing protein
MLGGKNKQPLGYTIIEVLIVLAVSGMMFVIAANFINGKQERTAFAQGSNDFAAQLQGVLEDVTDGHYSDIPLGCGVTGSVLDFSVPSSNQGSNQNCVFLGKIIHFYIDGTPQPENYEVFSLASARSPVPPVPVAAIPGLTNQGAVPQHLDVTSVDVIDAGGSTQTGKFNIGFAQSQGTAISGITDADSYQSGTQTIGLLYASSLSNTGPVGSPETTVSGSAVKAARSATICLTNGNRYARVFIGGSAAVTGNNGSQLSIRLQQLGTVAC